jgi:hypothetical protein
VEAKTYKEILTTRMTMDQSVAAKVDASRRGKEGPWMRCEMLPCPFADPHNEQSGDIGDLLEAGPSSSFNLDMASIRLQWDDIIIVGDKENENRNTK